MKPAAAKRVPFLCAAVVLLCAAHTMAESVAGVSLKEGRRAIEINNGLISLEISRNTGSLRSLRKRVGETWLDLGTPGNAMNWDANAEPSRVPPDVQVEKKGYFRLREGMVRCTVVENSPQRADVAVRGSATGAFPFEVEHHYVLFPGQSGFYVYVVLKRPAGLPGATLWQTRFVIRTVEDSTFTDWMLGDREPRQIPTAARVTKLMDATYRLADGSIRTKYMNSVYWAEAPVYGVAGKDVGLWMITASGEYHNGGPIKQGQTMHDRVLLRVLQSGHFGASPLAFADGETWEKVYGPVFVYVNTASSVQEMKADAQRCQREEMAKWPYAWLQTPGYATSRGGVKGTLHIPGGSAAGAWVILGAPGSDWTTQGKGYMFWTKADDQGRFVLPKVVPGTYTLFASGADQPVDLVHEGVCVVAKQTSDLGTIQWNPATHGQRVWQIGAFDRSAGEYRNGDDARHYQMFKRYPEQFPEDVTFTIGKSDIRKDWNYAHWSWYCKNPAWTIRFELPEKPAGKATLTVGIASAQPAKGDRTDVRVGVNGQEVSAIRLPKTGTAGYRGGVQDQKYNVQSIQFDAGLLKSGWNEITLKHADGVPYSAGLASSKSEESADPDAPPGTGFPGQLMYDALRLEIQK